MNTKEKHTHPSILIVEDEPLISMSLKKLLEKKGALVSTESSGKSAIDLILSQHYDRIVCDLMLQDISGFDVIEEAKQRYSIGEISDKFIIITAYSSSQVLEKADKYQCIVLSKPFEDLTDALNIIMDIK